MPTKMLRSIRSYELDDRARTHKSDEAADTILGELEGEPEHKVPFSKRR